MDKIIEVANKLHEEILNIPEVKEYFSLLKEIENNQDLQNLKKEICRLEKEGKKEEKDNLLKILNSNPLILNLQEIKKEIIPILEQIKQNVQ